MKKQNAEQTIERKINDVQAIGFEFEIRFAIIFSSKMNAAIDSSIKPMVIDQKVMETLENLAEFFRVKMTETARQEAERNVSPAPIIISDPKERS